MVGLDYFQTVTNTEIEKQKWEPKCMLYEFVIIFHYPASIVSV